MANMNLARTVRCVCLLLLVTAFAGCTSRQEPPPEAKGRVNATGAFVKHFGAVPPVDKGSCYGFVIYFPSAREAGKVLPFPFFSFDEASLKKVALGKLIAGMGDQKSYQGELTQPFPVGSRVLDVSQSAGTVTVNFSKELNSIKSDPQVQQAVVNAVTLTLRQFAGVTTVVFKVEGADSSLNKLVAKADESAVLPLAAPRLLGVTGMKEKGAANVEEIDAFFDRPVDIKELTLSGADGRKIEGDIYQSVFDMAGVLKARNPQPYQPGTPLKVRWKVTDKLGRSASGDADVALEIKEH
ncbi:GerMN domain-containing protein [Geomonas sp. Red69]|uniref:GerMN domain-containing protein n=1 Tax=Geomonas diazotrophica TaxID=2843197 RepID=A0ABX8JNT7_9BACT|nr:MULTISPECIES: GerMN domain-containing protein [Geomonas]MBU5637072.1 GerMN domain-containing protein [Geomonas diazotrophica]QWV99373.1 GerMN domain-containing protein [Geomonas nitrogeniifigens]